MPKEKPRVLLDLQYYEAAQEYLRNLPPRHFMEATSQALQRKIFLESMDVVHEFRPEVQTFNELLVLYPRKGGSKKLQPVVPDNMVVIHDKPITATGSFNLPQEKARPFWMLEYVSRSSKRKDYDDNMQRYEHDLQVPYYLLFEPDAIEMTLYKLIRGRYVSVKPNAAGRCPLPRLEMEVAIVDNWVRFWFRGELLPLPGELLKQVNDARRLWQEEKRRADDEQRRADDEQRRADDEQHRADDAEKRAQTAEQELARLRKLLDQPTS